METTLQIDTFILTVLMGAMLGLVFDFYRVIRGIFRPRWYITSLTDLLYWLFATVLVFIGLLVGNWGELRFYVFFGLFLGATVYWKVFSRYAVHALFSLFRLVGYLFWGIKKAFMLSVGRPVFFIIRIIAAPLLFTDRKIRAWRSPPPDGANPPK